MQLGKRGMNKRGQDLPIGAIILIILGVLVLVGIGIFFFRGSDRITNIFEQAPGKALEAAAQGCNIAAQGSLYIDYCTEFRKISSTDYINCQDSRLAPSLTSTLDCNAAQVSAAATKFCTDKKLKAESVVAGIPCSTTADTVTCDEVGAEKPTDNAATSTQWLSLDECTTRPAGENGTPVTDLVTDQTEKTQNAGKVCCRITQNS